MELKSARLLVEQLLALSDEERRFEYLPFSDFVGYCHAISRIAPELMEDEAKANHLTGMFSRYYGDVSITELGSLSDEMKAFILNIPSDITSDTPVVLSYITDDGPSYIYGFTGRDLAADPATLYISRNCEPITQVKMGDLQVIANRTLEIRIKDPVPELTVMVKDHEPDGIYALHDKAVKLFREAKRMSARVISPWEYLPFMEVVEGFKTYFETPLDKHDQAKEIFAGTFLKSVAAAVVIADPRYSSAKCEYRGYRSDPERYLVCGHESEINNNFKTLAHLEDFLRNTHYAEGLDDKKITINLVDHDGKVEATVINLDLSDLILSPGYLGVRENILVGTGISSFFPLKDFRKLTITGARALLIFRQFKD